MKEKLISFVAIFIILSFTACSLAGNTKTVVEKTNDIYVCIPCGSSCDTILSDKPGTCPHCHMELVKKSTIVHGNVLPEELCSYIFSNGNENIILLDVRTPEEFNGTAPDKFGRLKDAINIPVQDLQTRIKELDGYKEKEIIVYCSHSHWSPRASYMLTQNGFKHVTNMSGGMSAWKEKVKDAACNKMIFVTQ